MFSWLGRSFSTSKTTDHDNINTINTTQQLQKSKTHEQNITSYENEEEYYGVTQPLIDFVNSFTFDTFINFSLSDKQSDEIQTNSGGVRIDLSEWQQKHATVILSKVKELSQLRYKLCPRHLKERQFWRIYFSLVKSYVTEYELRAIRHDKLRKMASEDDKSSDTSGVELEMTETKQTSSLSSPP